MSLSNVEESYVLNLVGICGEKKCTGTGIDLGVSMNQLTRRPYYLNFRPICSLGSGKSLKMTLCVDYR